MRSAGPGPKRDPWVPRMWEGSDYPAYLRLLARNRFAVHPRQLWIAAIASVVTVGNMVGRWFTTGLHGEAVRRTALVGSPVFVIGHWRTGTTLLHELLCLDQRFTSPTYLHCFAPNHFLLTERLLKGPFKFMVPDKRPMDNMAAADTGGPGPRCCTNSCASTRVSPARRTCSVSRRTTSCCPRGC